MTIHDFDMRDGTAPPVAGEDGIPVVMGFAARRSHDGHRPVRLSEITG